MLRLRVRHRLSPRFALDVDVETTAPRLGVFGPSGSGKSSLLRCIAGDLRPREARLAHGEGLWQDTDSATFTPMQRRRVGYMTQDPLLFPHCTVEQNLRYSPAGAAASNHFTEVTDALNLRPLLGRMPRSLSGGEQHRVALGRALLSAPELLLLDEPFTGLDTHNRRTALALLDRVHRRFGVPWVLVSHRGADLALAADEVIVLEEGAVAAQGNPLECLAAHATNPMGLAHDVDNLLRGPTRPVPEDAGLAELDWGGHRLIVPAPPAPGSEAAYGCYANSLVLSLREPAQQSARNHLRAHIGALRPLGTAVIVELEIGHERLRALVLARALRELGLGVGAETWVNLKTTSLDPLS